MSWALVFRCHPLGVSTSMQISFHSQVRLCWTSRRPASPRRELSPSHLDLDNDAIDYDLACHQLQPLPPPKLMVTMMM